jgi:hypothetical protein
MPGASSAPCTWSLAMMMSAEYHAKTEPPINQLYLTPSPLAPAESVWEDSGPNSPIALSLDWDTKWDP